MDRSVGFFVFFLSGGGGGGGHFATTKASIDFVCSAVCMGP